MRPASMLHTSYLLDRGERAQATICPKCLGLGAISLIHLPSTWGAGDTCPICEGRGLVPRRNGYSDLSPATLSERA